MWAPHVARLHIKEQYMRMFFTAGIVVYALLVFISWI